MKNAHLAIAGLTAMLMLSCTSIAPIKITAGDQCFRCRRYISNERVAAESIDGNGFVSKFRGPACMAKYLAAHPDGASTLFVTDFATGRMLSPQRAFYVSEIVDRNTGETDYRAFAARTDADAYAAAAHVDPIDWTAVLDKAR
jgi:hypothetical protein